MSKIAVYALSAGFSYLSGAQPQLNMYLNWDAGFYIGIAEKGYYSPASYAFSPVFPSIIKGFGVILLGNYQIAGLVTSNLFSFLELIPAYMLFKHYSDKPGYVTAIWVLFPLYFVWGLVPYTEHVFSFFVLCSWWALKTNKKIMAILLAALTTLVRQTGVILFIPLVIYFALNEHGAKTKIRYVLTSLIIPICYVAWNSFAGWISGDPSAVFNAQKYFGQTFAFDYIIRMDFKSLLANYTTYIFPNHVAMPFLVSLIALACLLLIPKIYRKDKFLALYAFLNIALFVGFLPLVSTLRYLSAVFPLFLVLEDKIDMKLYVPICVLSSALMLYSFMQIVFIG